MNSYPAYKDSGLPWLGPIPQHWKTRRLKYLASIALSNVDKHSVDGEEEVRLCNYTDVYYNTQITNAVEFMQATAPTEQVNKFHLRTGDVLITKDSETPNDIAVPAVVREELDKVLCGYHLALLRPRQSVFGGYLRYVLASPPFRDHFRMSANGVTRFGLSSDDITTALALMPPLAEQASIVSYLDRKTADIERFVTKKRQLIALLNEQKTAIINQAITKGLNPDAPMKASGVEWLGEVPAHWQVRRNGASFAQRVEPGDKDLPVLVVSLHTGVTIGEEDKDDPRRLIEDRTLYKRTRKGDIAYNMMRMWQGAVGVVPVDGLVSPAYVVARPLPGTDSHFFNYLFRTDFYKNEVNRQSHGIVPDRNRLYWADFKQMLSPHPPPSEQQQIVREIERRCQYIEVAITRIEREIELINEYQTTLISEAVTGKIDVREEAGSLTT